MALHYSPRGNAELFVKDKELTMMDRPKYLAVDYDDTLFIRNSWKDFEGKANKPIVDLVKTLQERNWKIILWTCRSGPALDEAVAWCKEQGIRIDYVNENPEAIKWFREKMVQSYSNWSNKAFADVYIDDSAFNPISTVSLKDNSITGDEQKGMVDFLERFCEDRYKKKVLGEKT